MDISVAVSWIVKIIDIQTNPSLQSGIGKLTCCGWIWILRFDSRSYWKADG